MRSIRSWFTEDRASATPTDYTSQILAAQLATARGLDGIKSTAAYRGALTLIGHSTGVASLTGQHSDSLQPHLSTIARSMVDTGESNWLINVGSAGEVVLLPVTAAGGSRRAGPALVGLHIDDARAEPNGDATAARGINLELQAARICDFTVAWKACD